MLVSTLLQDIRHRLVVEESVVIVYESSVRSVVVNNVLGRDFLAEIGVERINAHIDHFVELVPVPFDGIRVGAVDQAHAGLPLISLEGAAVGFLLRQVAVLVAFLNSLLSWAIYELIQTQMRNPNLSLSSL